MECQMPNAKCQMPSCWNFRRRNFAIRRSAFHIRHFRLGFSFTEILFAVMILGIGFIMVAAMFPVAIRQTEANSQETITASVARAGNSFLDQVGATLVISPFPGPNGPVTGSALLPTFTAVPPLVAMPANQSALAIPGQVWSFSDGRDTLSVQLGATGTAVAHPTYLWRLVAKNLIQATDSRFAWVAMYKRDFIEQGPPGGPNPATQSIVPAPYAQVIMIGVHSRVKQNYDPVLDVQIPSPLKPLLLSGATISAGSVTPGPTIKFGGATSGAVTENSYVVISDDGNTGINAGAYNGRIYRLGTINTGGRNPIWNFAPGQGPGINDPAIASASVFVLGQGIDPNNAGGFSGGAQDVTVYTTYVQTP
jgi:type II secretory pathway pseudopilin PulG